MRASRIKATTMIEPLQPDTREVIDSKMVDKENVIGVAYSPKFRKWRAYLHVGNKQVFHKLCASKDEAITERHKAEVRFQCSVKQLPNQRFQRVIKAPKYQNTEKNLYNLTNAAKAIAKETKIDVSKKHDRFVLGKKIGKFIALVDLLVMEGAVTRNVIEIGMREEVNAMEKKC
jgi:hypothetical protein